MSFKKVGKSGGLTFPVQLRRDLNINPGDSFEILEQRGGELLLKRYTAKCIFCGGDDTVDLFHGKPICKACREEIKVTGGGTDGGN